MPKSSTRGPTGESTTFPGLMSQWTTPSRCSASRASAVPAAKAASAGASSGPDSRTRARSVRPGTNSIASQGGSAEGSAPRKAGAHSASRARIRSASRANAARYSGAPAWRGWTTLTATHLPDASSAPYTAPMPPEPSLPTGRNGPIARGSPGSSAASSGGRGMFTALLSGYGGVAPQ